MSVTHYALLAEVILTSSNNAVRTIDVSAVTATQSLAPGSYFLCGDVSYVELDDLVRVFAVAAPNVANPAIRSISIAPSAKNANLDLPSVSPTVAAQVLWADVATTIDPALFGFARTNVTTPGGGTVQAPFTPTPLWVSPEPVLRDDPTMEALSAQVRTRSGIIRTFNRGGPYELREIEVQYVDPDRTFDSAADPARSWESFWRFARDGRRVELHALAVSGTTLALPTLATRLGTFVLDEQTSTSFAPRRLSAGQELYGWTIGLRGYVP